MQKPSLDHGPTLEFCGAGLVNEVRQGRHEPIQRPRERKKIEKDFPHIVEMRVPLCGFGSKRNAMHRWHETRGIRPIHSTGRRDENNRDYIR
jgi:hypothetical protein